jgi:hypothetical protein
VNGGGVVRAIYNTIVPIVGISSDGNFYQVEVEGEFYWIRNNTLIEALGNVDSLEVVVPTRTARPTRTPAPTPTTAVVTPTTGNGTGLLGEYYNNIYFTGLALTRVDSRIFFNWVDGSPASGIFNDTFSIRWTGEIEPVYSQRYTLYVISDDGARLWVNGQQVINSWFEQGGDTVRQGSIDLIAGHRYDIRLEYYENGGGARIQLSWSSPSQNRQFVPQSALYPADQPSATATPTRTRTARPSQTPTRVPTTAATTPSAGNGTGLLGEYYNNSNLTNLALTRVDSRIFFNWVNGSPASGILNDTFSARWTGQIEPLYTEQYTFYITSDDGTRLWINGEQVINSWIDQSGDTERRGSIDLVAGQRYDMRLEYYENGAEALIRVSWSSANQRRQYIPQSALYPADQPSATVTPTRTRTARPTSTRRPRATSTLRRTNTPHPTSTRRPTATPVAYEGVLFEDDFEDNNLLGWDYDTTVARIITDEGNRVVRLQSTDWNGIYLQQGSSWTDYALEARVKIIEATSGSTPDVFFSIRRSSRGDYAAWVSGEQFWPGIGGTWDEEWHSIASSSSGNMGFEVWHRVKFQVIGDNLSLYVDDVRVSSVSHEELDRGGVGFGIAPEVEAYIDDVRVINLQTNSNSPIAVVTTTSTVNIRNGPGTAYSVSAGASPAMRLTIIGRNSDTSWLKVVTGSGEVGWIAIELVSAEGNLTTVPIVDS